MAKNPSAPLSDTIIVAVAQLVDDAQADRRDPSHSELEFHIKRAALVAGDPNSQGQTVGKAKRVRATLSWSMEHNPDGGGEGTVDSASLRQTTLRNRQLRMRSLLLTKMATSYLWTGSFALSYSITSRVPP